MADTGQVMFWSLGNEEIPISSSCMLHLPYLPGKEPFSDRLKQVVTRLGVLPQLYEAFPIKRPAKSWWAWWFGFWMDSPLTRPQCALLYDVFAELAKKSGLYCQYIMPFLAALQTARDTEVLLYVRLGPPGHEDLGWSTTFAHCPYCKVEAPLERWLETYPEEPLECPVCGE